ncbi:MAG: rimI [Oscillospiraceae bacterium]|jgi:ribosomal-protein-alanine N-acetyltransferase|nr:rimI [Oscillospiraceae bacterium]
MTKNNTTIKIVPMAHCHIDEIVQIEQETFSDEPWAFESFEAELQNRFSMNLIAQKGEDVVGYLMTSCVFEDAHINNLAVKISERKKGIAHMLVAYFTEQAVANGAKQITLEVRKSNLSAICLYQKHGFEPISHRKNFYKDPVEDALLLKKSLL